MGKQVRKQKKSSIVAGGFLRFRPLCMCNHCCGLHWQIGFWFWVCNFNQVPMVNEEDGRDITVVIVGKKLVILCTKWEKP